MHFSECWSVRRTHNVDGDYGYLQERKDVRLSQLLNSKFDSLQFSVCLFDPSHLLNTSNLNLPLKCYNII